MLVTTKRHKIEFYSSSLFGQLKCPSVVQRIHKSWSIYAVEYYIAIKRYKLLTHETTQWRCNIKWEFDTERNVLPANWRRINVRAACTAFLPPRFPSPTASFWPGHCSGPSVKHAQTVVLEENSFLHWAQWVKSKVKMEGGGVWCWCMHAPLGDRDSCGEGRVWGVKASSMLTFKVSAHVHRCVHACMCVWRGWKETGGWDRNRRQWYREAESVCN